MMLDSSDEEGEVPSPPPPPARPRMKCRGKFYLLRHGNSYYLLQLPCCQVKRYVEIMQFYSDKLKKYTEIVHFVLLHF